MSENEITLEPTLVALAVERALEEMAHAQWYREESKKWTPKAEIKRHRSFLAKAGDLLSRIIGN